MIRGNNINKFLRNINMFRLNIRNINKFRLNIREETY